MHKNSKIQIVPKLLRFAFCMLFISASANAGTLRSTPELAQCDYLFSGAVEAGDAQKIESMIPARASGTQLCLNSPGGDFVEGLRMFYTIWGKDSIATRVQSDDRCLSACAVAFLGGSLVVGSGVIRSKNAVIEPGAWLGFHAPRLVLPRDGVYDPTTVQSAYALALQDSARMFELTQKVEHGARGMSEFLFLQTLSTPPESMYNIDTIGKASLADIQLANIPMAELTWEGLRNVCDTAVIKVGENVSGISSAADLFGAFSNNGYDGSANIIAFEDRTWSWTTDYFMNFVIRGYQAPHVSEMFCKVSLSRLAFDRETGLPLTERDPTTQSFSVTLWEDVNIPVGETFPSYAEANSKADDRIAVPWTALWNPLTPLTNFAP